MQFSFQLVAAITALNSFPDAHLVPDEVTYYLLHDA